MVFRALNGLGFSGFMVLGFLSFRALGLYGFQLCTNRYVGFLNFEAAGLVSAFLLEVCDQLTDRLTD